MKLLCKKNFHDLKVNNFYIIKNDIDDVVVFENSYVCLSKTIKHEYYLWNYFYTIKEIRKMKLYKIS